MDFWRDETEEETYFVCLNMLTKLTELFDDPSAHVHVKRILVMDGGANGVNTLRAFDNSDDYYITILDDNQVKDRKFKHIQEETRYKYGNASLVDSQVVLQRTILTAGQCRRNSSETVRAG